VIDLREAVGPLVARGIQLILNVLPHRHSTTHAHAHARVSRVPRVHRLGFFCILFYFIFYLSLERVGHVLE
jgi:hypothetical protein